MCAHVSHHSSACCCMHVAPCRSLHPSGRAASMQARGVTHARRPQCIYGITTNMQSTYIVQQVAVVMMTMVMMGCIARRTWTAAYEGAALPQTETALSSCHL